MITVYTRLSDLNKNFEITNIANITLASYILEIPKLSKKQRRKYPLPRMLFLYIATKKAAKIYFTAFYFH
jgi:hypothetical protein